MMSRMSLRASLAVAVLCSGAAGANAALDFTQSNFNAGERAQIRTAFTEAQALVANALFYLRGNGSPNLVGEHPAFNRFFGPIYNQSATSPLAGTADFQQHKANLLAPYRLVRQQPIGEGLGTNTSFVFNPRPVYLNVPVAGDDIYITPRLELYPDPVRHPTYGSFITGGVTTQTINQGGGGNQQNQTRVLAQLTYLRPTPPYPVYNPLLDGILETVRPVVGDAVSLDAIRYRQLVLIMEKVQYALQNVDITLMDDFTDIRLFTNTQRTFFNPLPAGRINVGLDGFSNYGLLTTGFTRGLEQYGLSTGANADGILEWYNDPDFFTDKFGALAQDTTTLLPTLTVDQLTANLWLGQAALSGLETRQDSLFDGTDHSGETQTSDALHIHILKALIQMVSTGLDQQGIANAEATFNRTEFNELQGFTNQDAFTGDFLPGDLDINNIIAFLQDTTPIQQGGSANAAAGPPPGKQAIAGNAFAVNGINSGFGYNIVIPPP